MRVDPIGSTPAVAVWLVFMFVLIGVVASTSFPLVSVAEAAAAQPAQDEFVPMESVPPEDQLPAAPLLIAAYALLWMFVLGYLWSIWRRMSTVERELSDLSRRAGGS